MKKIIATLFIFTAIFFAASAFAQTKSTSNSAYLIHVKGGIGPAIQDHVVRGINLANRRQAQFVILQIDTPGGLSKSMRGIIKAILASRIPVIGYVAPSGARAASAGTYILYACHIAAMAPGTNLGAATPVAVGGAGKPNKDKKSKKPDASSAKAQQDAMAYIRGLAQLRGRNVKWAEKAVKSAASLSANEALKKNVINLVASSVPALMKQLNNRKVKVKGEVVMLKTQNVAINTVKMGWRGKFLKIITDPSVAYILLLVGIYGLFFEFANPGFIVPGVVGVISLLVALYAFQLLPINYVGLALIGFGIIFMVAEAFVPSFGALGIGGVIAFLFGSIFLLERGLPGFAIAWPIIIAVTAVTAVFFLLVVNMALRARFRPVVSGREELLGSVGEIVVPQTGVVQVRIRGELWQVQSDDSLTAGQQVKVIGRSGLILIVTRI